MLDFEIKKIEGMYCVTSKTPGMIWFRSSKRINCKEWIENFNQVPEKTA